MFSWINHNSLYILIFFFPIVITIVVYYNFSKNKFLLISLFVFLTLLFVLVKIFFQPNATDDIDQVELDQIINNESEVIIEFFSPNCMGCVLSEKEVNEFIEKYSEYKFIKLDVSDKRYSELVMKNFITVTPTFLYFKNGKFNDKYVGMLSDSENLYEKFNQE